MKKFIIISVCAIVSLLVLSVAAFICFPCLIPSNFERASCVRELSVPRGYERIDGDDRNYTRFLRSIPLKPRGSEVVLYRGGGAARFGSRVKYAVIDLPLLSNDEQCADVCMRLRAEYLFSQGKCGRIHFSDLAGTDHYYTGGRSRKAFESYMRRIYAVANTASLARELPRRNLKDVQPGDILVYPARKGHKYGHAIFVLDVAQNGKGQKMVMLAEGNTPACSMHIIRNLESWRNHGWFKWDENAKVQTFLCFRYHDNELRHF